MRFLVDANLPRSALPLLERFGHVAGHARDLGLGTAPDSEVAARARSTGSALLTRDLDFSDIRLYPPADYAGLVVMRLPDDATAGQIVLLLERFLKQPALVDCLPGHLVILEADRVRFRPPLTR
jgi:predicted nuclease of predicted toxin-antitoxin system